MTSPNAYEIIPSPFYAQGQTYTNPEILYSTIGFTQKGVTLKGGQGVLAAGTVLAQNSADKKYYPYVAAGPNGTGTARGILRTAVDTGAAGSADQQGNLVIAGILKLNMIVGRDATSDGQLGAVTDTVLGTFKI